MGGEVYMVWARPPMYTWLTSCILLSYPMSTSGEDRASPATQAERSLPMSTLPNRSQRSCTTEDVDAWLRAARERRAHLHPQAARSPLQSDQRQEAFTAMPALLQEALEEVRGVSEATREWSQNVRGASTDLRAHATQLRARSAAGLDRLAPFGPRRLRPCKKRKASCSHSSRGT